ncbi:cyclic nucleotide-binding domain-containing protein [Candidatus Entotheonella palauensis]|nr:cyclic nucleotide-binding domain-containing protein [Candidatus Entotheonella palauensis]
MIDIQSPITTEPENSQSTTALMQPASLCTQQLLFKDVTPESIQDVLPRCVERHLAPGDILLHRGDVNEHLYLILTGKVSIHLENLDDPSLTT